MTAQELEAYPQITLRLDQAASVLEVLRSQGLPADLAITVVFCCGKEFFTERTRRPRVTILRPMY